MWAPGDGGQEIFDGGRPRNHGVGPADVEPAVVVGPAGEVLPPGLGKGRGDAVFVGQSFHDLGGQGRQYLLEALALPVVPGPVHFKVLEQQEELFEMVHGEPVVDAVEGVGQDVKDPLFMKVSRQIEDVLPHLLDLPVMGLGDVVDQHMDLATRVREIRGNLLADKRPRQVGDFQRPVDGVVVGDGRQVHGPLFGDVVNLSRLCKTFRASQLLEHPLGGAFGKFGMDVKIDPGGRKRNGGGCHGVSPFISA